MTKGNKTASYTYDMSGVRSGKVVNGVSYEYTTLSGKITRMTWSGNAVDIVYDDAGRPYILRYTPSGGATQTYYYVLNLQGDVVGLMNTSMQMVVKYSYDPWGKLTGTTATSAYVALAQANPLRYRSYCYDIETGFYYLQSRYYDPTIARFINADGYLSTDSLGLLSYNMFAYCENNPVMCSDPNGKSANIFSNFCVNMTDSCECTTVERESLDNYYELKRRCEIYGLDFYPDYTDGWCRIEVTTGIINVNDGKATFDRACAIASDSIEFADTTLGYINAMKGIFSSKATKVLAGASKVSGVLSVASTFADAMDYATTTPAVRSLPDGKYEYYCIHLIPHSSGESFGQVKRADVYIYYYFSIDNEKGFVAYGP